MTAGLERGHRGHSVRKNVAQKCNGPLPEIKRRC